MPERCVSGYREERSVRGVTVDVSANDVSERHTYAAAAAGARATSSVSASAAQRIAKCKKEIFFPDYRSYQKRLFAH